MKKILCMLLIIALCLNLSIATAQQTTEKFIQETQYLLSLPEDYNKDTAARWPLMVFLHGSGESGNDIQKVKTHGSPKLVEKGKQFPFIIVSPQSDVPNGWDVDVLYKLLQQVKKNYRVNEKKIYFTGLSMGGFGTWAFAMKYPDELAAIAPICGGGDTSNAWKLRNVPVWCFHGGKDDVVPPVSSENMVKATQRYNPNVRFTLYPDANHNSWDVTYNNDSLYSWLLAQTKFSYSEKPINNALLKKYTGLYVGPDKDTVQIIANEEGLIAKPPNATITLKPLGENMFFLRPDRSMDIRFTGDKNKITGFLFMGDRKLQYRKIK